MPSGMDEQTAGSAVASGGWAQALELLNSNCLQGSTAGLLVPCERVSAFTLAGSFARGQRREETALTSALSIPGMVVRQGNEAWDPHPPACLDPTVHAGTTPG